MFTGIDDEGCTFMSYAKSEIMDLAGLSDRQKSLLKATCELFNIPCQGIIILFDSGDYDTYINNTWRLTGLHMNLERGGIEEMSPEHILKIMESRKYAHLIWFSKRVSESKDIDFSWTVSHEFRHLQQDIISYDLSRAGHFLYNSIGGIDIEEQKIDVTIPTELDAELAAWQATRKTFGVEQANAYVLNKTKSGNKRDSFSVLYSHDPDIPYNVIGNTLNLLKKYQKQLHLMQNETKDDFIKEFNVSELIKSLSSLEIKSWSY